MPTTTLEIDGSPVALTAANLWPARLSLRLRGVSTLTLVRPGGALGPTPDPWLGKSVVLKWDGVPIFAGDVADASPGPSQFGWTIVYQCRDLRARGDRVPFTDSNTLGDEARWNFDAEDEDKIDSRLGRTVGQILEDALTMDENAAALDGKGIGGYTSLSPPTLPAETLADLAAMTTVPPAPVTIGGNRLLSALEAFLASWAPNHAMWVRADGVIRFVDLRAVDEQVLTLDDCSDRLIPSSLSRSLGDCFTRVVVKGRAVAEGKLLSLSAGTLEEDFAWGSYDNAGAKAAWTEAAFAEDQDARSQGTISVTDLTHVVLTSDPATQAWGSNEWDQANRQGRLYLTDTTGSGLNYVVSSRVVANTAKSSGGTSTFTLETALPGTDFDTYVLYGLSSGASLVWRKYRATDPDIRDALARRMTYPVPYVLAGGGAATLTSYPIGSICWSTSGLPPYNEFSIPLTVNPGDGTFVFASPTYKMAGGVPADVRVLAAVYTQTLSATKPASGFEGTAYTVDGLEETLTVTVDSWRDPANQVNVEAYAQDLLDAVKDAVVEGSVVVERLYEPALGFGIGVSIEAATYDTGWEGLNIPVVEVDVVWNQAGSASLHTTTMRVSNRRASYAVGAYLQPERRSTDGTLGYNPASMMYPQPGAVSYQGDGGDGSVVMADGGDFGGDSGGGGLASFGLGGSGRSPKPSSRRKGPDADTLADRSLRQEQASWQSRLDASQAGQRRDEVAKRAASNERAVQIRDAERWKNQADPDAMRRQSLDTSAADRQRAEIDRRNAEKQARDDADGGQDWRDAP